jgi:hypothetical protein
MAGGTQCSPAQRGQAAHVGSGAAFPGGVGTAAHRGATFPPLAAGTRHPRLVKATHALASARPSNAVNPDSALGKAYRDAGGQLGQRKWQEHVARAGETAGKARIAGAGKPRHPPHAHPSGSGAVDGNDRASAESGALKPRGEAEHASLDMSLNLPEARLHFNAEDQDRRGSLRPTLLRGRAVGPRARRRAAQLVWDEPLTSVVPGRQAHVERRAPGPRAAEQHPGPALLALSGAPPDRRPAAARARSPGPCALPRPCPPAAEAPRRLPRAQIDGVEAYIADGAVAGKPAWCGPRAIVRSSACPISTG